MTVTVLLVDDHALIREGLRRAFEQTEDLVVIAEASSLAEARALERRHAPDVAVVDINLGDGSGLSLVAELRNQRPQLGLVVLTMYDGDEHLLAALDAGASCFVLKSRAAEVVVAAARQAAAAPGSFSAEDLAAALRRRSAAPRQQLTTREQQVLDLLADGAAVAEVARRLFISQSTAKSHITKLYEKLGAANRAQAVMTAVRQGLLPGS